MRAASLPRQHESENETIVISHHLFVLMDFILSVFTGVGIPLISHRSSFCFRTYRILYSLLDLRECLFEICEKVIDVFDTYGDADGARGDAGCLLGFRGKLLVGRGSRVNDKRLGVTDIG